MIDEIYKKERQYVPSFDKDNILTVRSPIFELQKYHKLKSHTGVEQANIPNFSQMTESQKRLAIADINKSPTLG